MSSTKVNTRRELAKFSAKQTKEATARVHTWWKLLRTRKGYWYKCAIICELQHPGATLSRKEVA